MQKKYRIGINGDLNNGGKFWDIQNQIFDIQHRHRCRI